ncbi:MAG: S8 family peptidase [Pricia sp.]
MSDKKFHLKIPNENVRNEKYEKTGGGISVPRVNHSEHGKKLYDSSQQVFKTEFAKKDSDLISNLFIQLETPNEVSLKSQRLKIENLGFEIINYSKSNKSIGTARIDKEELGSYEKRLQEYIESKDNVGKTYFAPIENISSIPVESKIHIEIDYDSAEPVSILINLYNVLSKKEKFAVNNTMLDEIRQFAKDVKHRDFVNGVSSIECTIPANKIPKIVSDYSTIKEIEENKVFFVEAAIPSDPMPNPLNIQPVKSDSLICVVDSGISSANGIFDNLVKDVHSVLPPTAVIPSFDHGTFVASRCVFGDSIDDCLGSHQLSPYCNLVDAPIFGYDAHGLPVYPTELDLRTAMEDIVIKYKDIIKVYNLSLGSPAPISDFKFSELAKLLDYLSKEYKVLFIIASGNINSPLGTFPSDHFGNSNARIGCPAESILSLTVGSIAKYDNANSLSESNMISPFSRIGPGSDLGVKPEIVAHGGNMILPYSKAPRISTYGITKEGLNLAVDIGTSFAAPIISQYAQKLFDMYPNSDPNLVKGLLCHFSEIRNVHDELTEPLINFIGFGEPNINNAIEAKGDNAVYIYEGKLNQDDYQHISFHIPDSLASDNPDAKLKVKITITYDPVVNVDNELEYSSARISANLFKPSESEMKQINITGDDKYSVPWNPVIRFEKSFSRSYLTGEWDLRLRLYTRGKVAETYEQDYSAVIEIMDEKGNIDVYDEIVANFGDKYLPIEMIVAA